MKKVIKDHAFSLSLLALCTFCSLYLLNHFGSSPSDYQQIEVQSGESLWQLATDYEEYHGLSHDEFIKWVKRENQLESDRIAIGQQLVIPVKEADHTNIELLAVE